jgi:hypothetical protein
MGEYEPDDSRDVTLSTHQAPGEPPRTGPREGETRQAEEKHGVADPEAADKPTARDAHGNKQPGYASEEDSEAGESTEQHPPLGK